MAGVKAAKAAAESRIAEAEVVNWEAMPSLLSDSVFTFAKGTAQETPVKLKILSGEYYMVQLLPQLEEWATAVFRGNTLEALRDSTQNPVHFMLELFKRILARPKNDRVKVSFYEACAATFSTEETEITPQFFAVCPPDEQLGAILKLVETNRANFTRFWEDLPSLLKRELTLLYITIIKSIQSVNMSVINTIKQIVTEFQPFPLNGGAAATGPDGYGPLPEESPQNIEP